MSIILIRTLILYVLIVFCVRLMGKRQIGQLQPSELCVTILISNIATMSIEDSSIPLFSCFIPILMFMCLEIFVSYLSMKFRRFRRLVTGAPKIVIRGGQILPDQLKELRFTIEDLFEELRVCNVFDIDEVMLAIVETNGTLTVHKKSQFQNTQLGDMNIQKADEEPPILIVADGNFLEPNLTDSGISKEDALKFLHSKKTPLKKTLVLTVQEKKRFNLIKKESA